MDCPVVEVASIIMHEGQVLIGRPTGGKWKVPGSVVAFSEELKTAAIRSVFSLSGVFSDPQDVIFVSEVIDKNLNQHRVIVYVYSTYIEGDPKPNEEWGEVQWHDVRQLGDLQPEMDEQTIDAFYKFSLILQQSIARAGAQA